VGIPLLRSCDVRQASMPGCICFGWRRCAAPFSRRMTPASGICTTYLGRIHHTQACPAGLSSLIIQMSASVEASLHVAAMTATVSQAALMALPGFGPSSRPYRSCRAT